MRLFVLDGDRVGLDISLRAIAAGHDVRLFRPPGKSIKDGNGFPGLTITSNLKESIKWTGKDGLVITTANCKYLDELDRWRAFGYNIFAPTKASAKLEIDRALGMEVMKIHGMNIAPYHEFTSMKAALDFAWKTDKCFVFKPLGDTEDKSLTFVPKDPAQLVGWLDKKIKSGSKIKGNCMLQEKIDMVAEVGIAGFMGSHGFLDDKWEISFEHKKMMPGDFGPSTGEQGCYSPDTEVLTDSGWKFWPDVTMADKIATLVDGAMVFEAPIAVVSFDYNGDMYNWKSQKVNLNVTAMHNMYVQDCHARKDFFFESAKDTAMKPRKALLTTTSEWVGSDDGLPSWVRCNPEQWAAFMGIYIADGYCKTSSNRSIELGNLPSHKIEQFSKIIAEAGYPVHLYGNTLAVHGVDLRGYLEGFGKALVKHVPGYIKNGSAKVIRSFLTAYAMGDGCQNEDGSNLIYTTISKQLADDVQEMAAKIGWTAMINARDRRDEPSHIINGIECFNRHIAYDISIGRIKKKAKLLPKILTVSHYEGKVYCATVSTHVMYVRRAGKPVWCGNTVINLVKDSKLADQLKNLEAHFRALGHMGDVAINGGVTSKGEYMPFEFTVRAGWPDDFIRRSLHLGNDEAQWMLDACRGHDTLKVKRDVAIGLVYAQKPYPYEEGLPEMVEGNPIYGVDKIAEHVHFAQVMMGRGPVWDGSKTKDDKLPMTSGSYVAVITGHGNTVKSAQEAVIKNVKSISLADAIVRNDVGSKLEKQLPILKKLGFNEMPDYE